MPINLMFTYIAYFVEKIIWKIIELVKIWQQQFEGGVDALGTQMSVDPIWGKEGERSLIFQRFIPENYIKLLNCGAGVTFIDASSNRQFVWAKSILNVDPSPSFAAALVTQSCPPVNYTSLIGWYWLNISLQTASKIEETENSVSLDCFCNCGQLSLPSNLWI